MDSSPYQTVILPVNLGQASGFNRAIFPLSRYQKRDSIGRGDLYLDGTLDEMLKITTIGTNPQQWQEILATTKARYDQLILQKAELEQRPKSKNPLKAFANYRAARMFLAAAKSLYLATRSRSEDMLRSNVRNLLSFPGEDVQPVDNPPDDENVVGIAIKVDRPLDDPTKQQLLDAADTITGNQIISGASSFLSDEYVLASESLTSLLGGVIGETLDAASPPTPVLSSSIIIEETADVATPPMPVTSSPTIIIQNKTYNNFYGSIYSPNSNISGATAQLGGEYNSGSVIHTTTPSSAT